MITATRAAQTAQATITYPAELHQGTDGQPGNASTYDFSSITPIDGNPWQGKTLAILGSSVAYGACSLADGPGEYIARRLDMRLVKEAVSGTTLADLDDSSYVHRLDTRLPASLPVDVFICQLSTNDASHGVPLGNAGDTDTHTVAGALNHIAATVRERWNCPLMSSPARTLTARGIRRWWSCCLICSGFMASASSTCGMMPRGTRSPMTAAHCTCTIQCTRPEPDTATGGVRKWSGNCSISRTDRSGQLVRGSALAVGSRIYAG